MRGQLRRNSFWFGWAPAALLCVCVWPAAAQVAPAASVSEALRDLHVRAGVAFAGEVVALRRVDGVVEVEFRVDEAIKGEPGASYVLREWSGLWAAGQRRYWVGERAMVFLHAPGRNGLSSSVDGMEGILPMGPSGADGSARFDVARLRTRVMRAAGAPMSDAEAMSVAELKEMLQLDRDPRRRPRPVKPLPDGDGPLPLPAAGSAVENLVGEPVHDRR